ncbi:MULTISPECIES: K(+)-transporting ATPase subunit F [Streptomyces]|uniref:Small membrane protein n=2 Tax=Streptomyces TaxID=1883 RepID=A0A380P639_STRGR|nr:MULTISPECIES: K(+)-transporting ATPase subunit F [Streptomyces]NEC11503.1 K(+)-transporting ATPase subunit F [Streptomyces sp. SID8014]NEE35905.1 K(+)-transporting ATPase subunit F [Streptomyces sp. SID7982]NEE43544.1 K(+)-transporting ATPase subunit F [Streptomyces sp. SID8455]MBL3803078.1 K(+)-transporting ATPase subunit F [Streptomyces sp. BRB081]MDQ0292074.1 K+-transporting ATPase KdpF subunit [Streptomyces sp. DSM 41037]
MTVEDIIGLTVAVFLLGHLILALLAPERF